MKELLTPSGAFWSDAEDINEGLDAVTTFMASAALSELTARTGTETHLHNVMLHAKSCAYDVNLASQWVTPNRWSILVRQYLSPEAVDNWVDMIAKQIGSKKRGLAYLRTNDVQSRVAGGRTARRWGSCMLGFGWRSMPTPQLTLHSRTSYIGGLSSLDVGVAHKLAERVGSEIGLDPSEIEFVWHLEAGQMHYFRCLAWWFAEGPDSERVDLLRRVDLRNPDHEDLYPTAWGARKIIRRIKRMDLEGKRYEDEAFMSFSRVRRMYHIAAKGLDYSLQFGEDDRLLKPVMLSSLTLDPIYRKNKNAKDGSDYAGILEIPEEDEDE